MKVSALLLLLAATFCGCIDIVAPGDGATVLGGSVHVLVEECTGTNPSFQVTLDGKRRNEIWRHGAYPYQWVADLPLEREGAHRLVISGYCGNINGTLIRDFSSRRSGTVEIAERLAQNFMSEKPASKLAWDWGEAIFMYGLLKLDTHPGYLLEYQKRWQREGVPSIDRSGMCPAALPALDFARRYKTYDVISNAEKVAHYLKNEPRNHLRTLDHLGHSYLSHLFPSSIWVDSLMMYAVFGAQWANYTRDEKLLEFSANQPISFASVLQDHQTGLFFHAWLTGSETTIPVKKIFWLRGNAWVMAAIVEILEELPTDALQREPLIGILQATAAGFVRYQMHDGLWDTILNTPGRGYAENSGSVLAAFALARGVHRGWLPPAYLDSAKRAFAAVTGYLTRTKHGLSMPRISGPTNADSLANAYYSVGLLKDAPHGIGAYLMAAKELEHEAF